MNLPNDAIMLMSVINTKLRDEYASLDELCDDMDISAEDIKEKLQSSGFVYNNELNKFC